MFFLFFCRVGKKARVGKSNFLKKFIFTCAKKILTLQRVFERIFLASVAVLILIMMRYRWQGPLHEGHCQQRGRCQ